MQRRFHDYLSEIHSKGASEVFGYTVGIGATFGFDVLSYDGITLTVTSDVNKNFRHNLTSERGVLTGAKSGVITPDGILTIETGDISMALPLGTIGDGRDIMVLAQHKWSATEGGTKTTYRTVFNTPGGSSWLDKLKDPSARINTWYDILGSQINRSTEVVIAYALITQVGTDYVVSEVRNPYNYEYQGDSIYVLKEEYDVEIENIKNSLPKLELYDITFTGLTSDVSTRPTINGSSTSLPSTITMNQPEQSYIRRFGSIMDILMSGSIQPSQIVDLSNQIIANIQASISYTAPVAVSGRFLVPVNTRWLTTSGGSEQYWNNTHACEGLISISGNSLTMVLEMAPVFGSTSTMVDTDLSPVIEFFGKTTIMDQLEDSFEITLQTRSQEGTTGSGTVTGGGRFTKGRIVTVIATPSAGSGFVSWNDGPSIISSSPSYQFSVTGNRILTAVFNGSSSKVEVKASSLPQGMATFTGTGLYTIGSKATITCTPNQGYTFLSASVNGATGVTTNPVVFTVTKASEVVFTLNSSIIQVVLVSQPAGYFALTGDGSYAIGSSVKVSAVKANDKYVFQGWYLNSVLTANKLSSNPTSTIVLTQSSVVNGKITLIAYGTYDTTPEPTNEYYLGITVVGNGSVTPLSGWYLQDTIVYLTAIPGYNEQFYGWDGQTNGSTSSFNMTVKMDQDRRIRATFSDSVTATYTLTMKTNNLGSLTGGTTTPSIGTHTYENGAYVNVIATPYSGYEFIGWRDANGQSEGNVSDPGSASTYTRMNNNITLIAAFRQITETQYTIYGLVTTSQGTITGSSGFASDGTDGTSSVIKGMFVRNAVVSLTASPKSGYKFRNWTYNGLTNSLSTSSTYQFVVTGSNKYRANFDTVVATNNLTYSVSFVLNPGSDNSGEYAWPTGSGPVRVTITLPDGRGVYNSYAVAPSNATAPPNISGTVDMGSVSGKVNLRITCYEATIGSTVVTPQFTISTSGTYEGEDSQEGRNYSFPITSGGMSISATLMAGWRDPNWRPS